MDVYQGKTTLEITYKDSVAVDSVVVFKDKTDGIVSKMDGELLKVNDLKKQLDYLTTEIINQKHEEN